LALVVEASAKRLSEIEHFLNARPEIDEWALQGKTFFFVHASDETSAHDLSETLVAYLRKNSKVEGDIPSHLIIELGNKSDGELTDMQGWLGDSMWQAYYRWLEIPVVDQPASAPPLIPPVGP
jgi:hypothetical protein